MAGQENERTHVDYFDYLRLIATFSVIFMHTAAEGLRTEVNAQWELLNAVTSFAFTAVPLFLMMSGYLLLSSERTADIRFLLCKRLPRLGIPLAAWTVIASVRMLLAQGNLTPRAFLSTLVGALHDPVAIHFWYMYVLIAFYVMSPILYGGLQALNRGGRIYLAALLGVITVQAMLLAVLPDRLDRLIDFDLIVRLRITRGYLCTFLMGFYLGSLKKRIPNRVLLPLTVGLWAVIAAGTHILTVRNGEYDATFQAQNAGFEVALAACLFLLFKQNAKPARLFRAVPVIPLCMVIYFMHGILLAAVQHMGYFPEGFGEVLALTALNFAACYLAAKTLATIKPLCFLLTGIPYADACRSCNWVHTVRGVQKRFKK